MSKSSHLKFITGSEGNLDYVVIAQSGDNVIGIKPMIGALSLSHTFTGFRVRATRNTLQEGSVVSFMKNEIPKNDGFAKAFPEIPFAQSDETRASVLIGAALQIPIVLPSRIEKAIRKMNLPEKAVEYVASRVDKSFMEPSLQDACKWIADRFRLIVEDIRKDFPEEDVQVSLHTKLTTMDNLEAMLKAGQKSMFENTTIQGSTSKH